MHAKVRLSTSGFLQIQNVEPGVDVVVVNIHTKEAHLWGYPYG